MGAPPMLAHICAPICTKRVHSDIEDDRTASIPHGVGCLRDSDYEMSPKDELEPDGKTNEVFLGGSCGDTTWRRDEAVPHLDAAGVSYYNPQVDDWHSGLIAEEAAAKDEAAVLLFFIDNSTRGIASLVEVAALIAAGRNVVMVVSDVPEGAVIAGDQITASERKDLNRGRKYLLCVAEERMEAHGNVIVCYDIAHAVKEAARLARALRMDEGVDASVTTFSDASVPGNLGVRRRASAL